MDITATPEWQALATHYEEISTRHLRELFANEPDRAERMTAGGADLVIDYSKQRATDETLRLLFDLARAARVEEHRDAMFAGKHINTTEDRAVLHVALRMPPGSVLHVDGQDVVGDVQSVLGQMGDQQFHPVRREVRARRQPGHPGALGFRESLREVIV